jgi:hypothetical protein
MLPKKIMGQSAVLSDKAAAAIQAVEGLSVPPVIQKRIKNMRKKGMSNDEIRASIIADFTARAVA